MIEAPILRLNAQSLISIQPPEPRGSPSSLANKGADAFEAAGGQDGGPAPSRSLVIPIAVQGARMSLLVDTGLHDVLLYKDRLRKGLPNVRTEGESCAAVIGRLHATKVTLPGVKIVGPETVEKVFLIDGPENGNPSGIDGYLGPLSLHARRLELDFAGHRLRWQ